jgi:2-oxoisovalerate dehydrogenase E1 component alpha subunit
MPPTIRDDGPHEGASQRGGMTMMHTLTPTADPVTDIDDVARLVTADGERVADRELDPWIADIDAEALRGLYRDMVIVRRIDSEGIAL